MQMLGLWFMVAIGHRRGPQTTRMQIGHLLFTELLRTTTATSTYYL
jgi:hypothetical protein